jgi:hypothetical protein
MTQVSFENFDNCYSRYFGTYVNSTNFYQGSYYDGDDIKGTYLGINEYILYDSEQNEFHVLLIDGQFHDANDDDEEEEEDDDEEDDDEEDDDEEDDDEEDDDEEDDDEEDDDEEDDDEADEEEEEEDRYYQIVQTHFGTTIVYTQPAIDIINEVVRENNDFQSLDILYILATYDYSPQFTYLYNSEYRQVAALQIQVVSGRADYGNPLIQHL